MVLLLQITFWLSLFLFVYSYAIYPILIRFLARNKQNNNEIYSTQDNWPFVSVLMAAHNEEKVIEEKLQSLFEQEYPSDRIKIFIGSDNSSDDTNDIITTFAKKNKNIHFIPFTKRQGKPGVITKLVKKAAETNPLDKDHVFLMTDASVILEPQVVKELVKHFKNPKVGLVDANMQYVGSEQKGISRSENSYLSREVSIKHAESKLFGKMIGPFGGCFAMRSDLYQSVPQNYLVDDFFLSMKVSEQDYLTINDMTAVCYEQVSHDMAEEYRRKQRISTGNYQNLFHFKHLLNPFKSLGFVFISHKVLRWIGPFLMILIFLSALGLCLKGSWFYSLILVAQLAWYLIVPVLDKLLSAIGVNSWLLRSIAYFNKMNIALFVGFLNFIKGVNSNIWEPTKRE